MLTNKLRIHYCRSKKEKILHGPYTLKKTLTELKKSCEIIAKGHPDNNREAPCV